VKHLPSGETWVVAWADDSELMPCGWPEGFAKISDCELIESCSDEDHWKLVGEIADMPNDPGRRSIRKAYCFALLDQRHAQECTAIMHL
jgi:hypothetical protein